MTAPRPPLRDVSVPAPCGLSAILSFFPSPPLSVEVSP